MIRFKERPHGFVYGAAVIERLHHDKTGRVVLSLKTDPAKEELEIAITKTGKIRIFSKKYIPEIKEWKYTEWKKEV